MTLIIGILAFVLLATVTTWFAAQDRPVQPPTSHPADEFDPRLRLL